MNIKIDKKDDVILKILHYFITQEDYKPIIINGLENEIWLENMQNDLKLIRININYIHNNEQYNNDIYRTKSIMKSIKKNTFSFNMNMLNLLVDASSDVSISNVENIETVKVNKISDIKRNKVVKEFFPKISNSVLNEKVDPMQFMKLTDDMNQKTIKNEKKLAKIFSYKKPVITYLLIVINLMIFMYSFLYDTYGNLINNFSNNYLLFQKGEYYRIFTSMFIHSDVIHLLFNMYALYILGTQVERYYGKFKFSLIYIISGLLGGIFSCVFMSDSSFSIGASGAIFGLIGSITYFTYYYRSTLQSILKTRIFPVLIINLLIGILIPGIDMFAHIGGFIGGLLISMAIGVGDRGKTQDKINGIIVLLLMFIIMIYMIFTK